ncbi:TetR/AcrR family transcriptional regulator [Amycolatopsis sp. H20-H5]|uniref:TetR/AcrR family transcriptional regulator n=1 Tax=Amycolatopsis sp. H20-H5 TaxID=3046309 RepID=UPI002DB630D9|nr:TetR/AcrR family transcriptional regulator [Amycolatopsis sp. H20-H5]MEC3975121.1 TetR/AcrR family transcriptional regulator [Amycolatopsis sp. H20-H5]
MDVQAGAPTEQGRRTQDSIVDSAAALMYTNGVAATSVDKVLAACGAGKSQMYHYFKNKDQLVEAVIGRYLETILANQPAINDLHDWAAFDRWTEQLLDIQRGPQGPIACPLGNIAGELGDDPRVAGLLDKAYREWESHLARGLIALRDKGELAADADPARLAQTAMACLQGGLMLAHIRRDITPLADALAVAVGHLKSHAR